MNYRTPRPGKALGVVCVMMAIALAVLDSVRIVHAWRLIGVSAVWATAWGALGMVATTLLFIRAGKRDAWKRHGLLWAVYRLALLAWGVVALLGLVGTHSSEGSDRLTTNLTVGVTTYTAALFCLLFFNGGLRMMRPQTATRLRPSSAGPDYQALTLRTHDFGDPHHKVEVWHVHLGRDEPDYYIAHCDCDWVGTAYDRFEPGSEQSARREANSHSANVSHLVVEI